MKTENQEKGRGFYNYPDLEEDELRPINIALYKDYEEEYDIDYTRGDKHELIDCDTLIQITINPKVRNSDVVRELQNMIELIRKASKNCTCFCCS